MSLFSRYIGRLEEQLAQVDEVFKECGIFRLGAFEGPKSNEFSSVEKMIAAVNATLTRSDAFFGAQSSLSSFRRKDETLVFESIGEAGGTNNLAKVRCYESLRKSAPAVLIVPHWNAFENSYDAMAKALSFFGFSAYVLTLPHHNSRSTTGYGKVANDFLNADLGATIRSVRQSVCEVRSIITWLKESGKAEVHLIGVSLGSSIASLTAAFDGRLASTSLFLTAGDFADTVWTGRATRHIRAALEGRIELSQLREIWKIISPLSFLNRFRESDAKLLVVTGRYDNVVPFEQAKQFIAGLREVQANVDWRVLPCGHYTLACFPYSWLSLVLTVRFMKRH